MRAIAAAALLWAALAAPAAADAPDWRPDVREARTWAQARAGSVSFAVRTEKRVWGHRMDTTVPSASVVKAMLLVTYLNDPDVRDRPLRAADRRLLRPMVRESDNIAATRVRDRVGNARLATLARRAGMDDFRPDPWWGRSRITAADQTRLFLRIDDLVVRRHRAFAMRELASIVPSQRWGIGAVQPAGWELHFKGGWGSGTGAVDHQVALLIRGEERVAVAIMTTANPSHAYGTGTLEGVARRLLRGLAEAPLPEG